MLKMLHPKLNVHKVIATEKEFYVDQIKFILIKK